MSNWIEILIGGFIGLATCLGLIPIILHTSRRHGFGSRASELHHTHHHAVPRLGGIALAVALSVVFLVFSLWHGADFYQTNQRWRIVCCSLAMFGLGLWDDLFPLGARRKLFGQILIASCAFFLGIGIYHFRIPFVDHIIDLGFWALPVTVLWLVALTNLINLIDGVDGLAGGISLMLLLLLAYLNIQSGSVIPILAAGMVGALLGFLRFNFPPARIYLGDGGAYFLGFLIGCLAIVASQKGTIFASLAAPLFVLALPIIDTSLAILRRGLRGLPLFRPDRKHLHHRLLGLGYSRRKVVLGLYVFTAFFLLLAFSTVYWHGEYFALFLGIGTLSLILAAGRFKFSREWFSVGRVLGNSLESRAEIQYAMSLCNWLAHEGRRASTLGQLAGDVAFVARKLNFSSLQIRLEDEEKTWPLSETNRHCGLNRCCFQHYLPGHKYCFLELCAACANPAVPLEMTAECQISEARIATFSILAELVAEGWSKAAKDWMKLHQQPARFDARPAGPAVIDPDQPGVNNIPAVRKMSDDQASGQ
jgi:UDP-GlcNAc:undecaprenyl-phosphate/decaprenyl-phosphate GlcNAc-1-phosphate transferase